MTEIGDQPTARTRHVAASFIAAKSGYQDRARHLRQIIEIG
jgi:hypothetical protein